MRINAVRSGDVTSRASAATPRRELTLVDSVSLITGIIVGVGVYQVAPDVARGSSSVWGMMAIWLAGGILSLCGALSYAELASAYPQQGGDYAYLTRAYGRWAGFVFGWIQMIVVRPGDIAVVAFTFATYAGAIGNPFPYSQQILAGLAVAVFTGVNVAGVKPGKWTQNVLTFVKITGLLMVVGIALFLTTGGAAASNTGVSAIPPLPLSLAMILVLFTFGGWNEMAFVAAEVKNPERNIWRALVFGTLSVTVLYLLVNGAFVHALGFEGLKASGAVAADAVSSVLPTIGGTVISVLICISALGALSGLIFAGARISFAVGCDHRFFSWLGKWEASKSTPTRALVAQGSIAIGLIAVLGSFLDTLLYTAAPVYLFFLSTNVAVFVLRRKDPNIRRPFRIPGYPLPPLLFGGVCGYLIFSAVAYRPLVALVALGIILLGFPVYRLQQRTIKEG